MVCGITQDFFFYYFIIFFFLVGNNYGLVTLVGNIPPCGLTIILWVLKS